jgi:uncharacterized protein DUF4382
MPAHLSVRHAVGLLVLLVACSDRSSPGPTGENTTRVLLTDDPFPFDRVERVDLYVVSVSGSLTADTSAAGSFVTMATPNRTIDLLALQNGVTDELGALELPEGIITAVRLTIDTDLSSITLKDGTVLTGSSTPGIAWQSSAGRPVLNALIHEQIEVPDSGGTVVIDFDVGKAFITPQEIDPASTDDGFIFSPVLRAADGTKTGSITGAVRSGGSPVVDASLRLYLGNPANAENTWSVLGTAHSDAAGGFEFSFVTRSAYWAQFPAQANSTYIVAVDPPSGLAAERVLVPNVTVTTGHETALGTIDLP